MLRNYFSAAVRNLRRNRLYAWQRSGKGHKETVQLLLDEDADIDRQTELGETALFWAARNGHREIVQLLLAKGADIHHQRKDGATALYFATQGGHMSVAQILLAKGAKIFP